MARPRKPSDPIQWPVPCGRCGDHHQIVANWPDGGVCGYCYQQPSAHVAPAVRPRGRLPGRSTGSPPAGDALASSSTSTARPAAPRTSSTAAADAGSCELAALVDQLLTNPDTGVVAPELVPVAAALKSMKRSNSGATWIRQRHVTAFLK